MTLWLRTSRQNPGNGGDQPSAQKALAWGSFSRGAGSDVPFCPLRLESLLGLPTSARKPSRASRKGVQPQNKTKKGKTKQAREAKKQPPRVREKGLRRGASNLNPPKYRENPKIAKTPGAQNGTPTKRQKERTHGQNGRQTRLRWGHRQKGTRTQSACGGVPCYYLSCLSLSQKKRKDDDVGEKDQRRREKNPKHQT